MNKLLLFLLLLITGSAWAQAPTQLFYSQQSITSTEDRIFSVNLANNVATSIANDASNFGQPNDLAFDPINNFIYVVDNIISSGPILRYTYDPVNNSVSGRTIIVAGTSGATYQGVAVDGVNGRLYFTQSSATSSLDALKVATGVNGGGSYPVTQLASDVANFANPNDLVYDGANSKLYVIDQTVSSGPILRYDVAANGLSVSGRATIVAATGIVNTAYGGLALDVPSQRLYFTQYNNAALPNSSLDALKYADLSNNNAIQVIVDGTTAGFTQPTDLALDRVNGHLYVADQPGAVANNYIYRYNTSGGTAAGQTVIVSPNNGSYSGLALNGGAAPLTTINSITRAGTNPTNASTVQYTVTFAASVTGLTTSNFSLTTTGTLGSTPSVSSVSGSGTTYTVTVNTGSGSGTLQLNLNSATGLTPSVSNVPYTSGDSYTIDKTAPSAPVVTTPANGSFLVTTTPTYAGTAEVNATVAVLVDGSAISTTMANGSGIWTITQPTALTQGSHTVRATATDAAGNTSPSSNTNTFLVDTTPPSVVISSTAGASGSSTTTAPIPFTITFSESVTGFVQGDLMVTGGSISGFSGAGTTYTFNVTPSSGTTVTVNVAANVAQDQVGNGNTTATPFSLTYQQLTTTVASVTRLTPSPAATAQVSYRVVFSSNVTGLTTSNFGLTTTGLSGATVSSVSGSGSTYTVVVNTGTDTGTLRLNVANGTGISSTISNVPYTSGEQYTITKNFAAAPVLRIQGTGSASGNSDVTAFVDAVEVLQSSTSTVVANALQNGSFETNNVAPNNYLYQSQGVVATPWTFGPQAGISRNNSAFGSTAADGDAVVFLQSAVGNNGSVSQNLALPTGSYQIRFRALQRNYTSLDQRLNVFINDVFIGNIQSNNIPTYGTFTSAAFSVTAPALTATVSTISASPTTTSPIPFSVSFSQSVGSTFTASDVTIAGGTLTGGSFSGSGSGPYTFTVTPSGTGTVTVSLAASVASDANNTGNTASNTVSVQYTLPQTAAPVVTAPANGSNVASSQPTYTGTAPANSTVTVYVDGTSIGTVMAEATGSFSLTQPSALAQGSHTVRATAQLSGQAVSNSSSTNTFTIDTVRPTVAVSSTASNPTSISPIPVRVTFSEAVTGFVAGDVTVTGGTISGFSGSGSTYTFSVTPSASGTVTVNVSTNVAQDAAGNGNTAATLFSIQYNQPQTAAPVVVVPANGSVASNNTPTYSGTAVANSTVTVYVDGAAIGTSTATGAGSFSLLQPTPLTQGSHTVYATAQLSGQTVSVNSNTNTFTVNTTATYLSSTADQPATERVQAGSTNQVILRVAVVVEGDISPLSAESFALTTTGSTSAADIAAARLYYTGTGSSFTTATPFGSAVAAPSGAFTINGTQQLASGTNYFWLVYDVAPAATPGNVLDAAITSLRLSGTSYTPAVTTPVGNRQVIQVDRGAGNAVRFAGGSTPGYVSFSATPLPLLGTQYSQEIWVKPILTGVEGSTYYVLGSNTPTANTAAPFIAIGSTGRVFAGFGTGSSLFTNAPTSTPLNSVVSNTWNHVVTTYDGINLRIYVNGDLVTAVPAPVNLVPFSTPVTTVGSAAPLATNLFPGDIDEVSMWSRALSQTEIRQRQHLVHTGLEEGLVSYLQFNEGTTTVTDVISGALGSLTGPGIARVPSTAPIGSGSSSLQSISSASTYSFAGTNAAINFTMVASTPYDVVVTRLEGTPLGTQVTDANLRNTHTRAYWIVNKYSPSNFAATITYTLDPGLISTTDAATPGVLKLYKRGSNSDGAFDAPISATDASATANTVSFPVTSFSQTFIGTYGSSPLPVQLVRFKAEARGTGALLRWSTSQELNNDRFEVERSTDGRSFQAVGSVAGAGTSVAAHNYTFTDAQAGQVGQQVFYRLRQVDTDGKSSLSGVEIVQFGATPGLVLWPNPSTDRLYLNLSSFPEPMYTVLVMDGLGRTVLTTQVTPSAASTVSVAELPAGSYILHVLGANTRTTRHFIKQK